LTGNNISGLKYPPPPDRPYQFFTMNDKMVQNLREMLFEGPLETKAWLCLLFTSGKLLRVSQ
jgi:hypothetical protein